MSEEHKIHLKAWSSESHMTEPTGETVSIYAIAQSITPLNFAKLLDNYLNLGGMGFGEGKLVGLHLQRACLQARQGLLCLQLRNPLVGR